MRKNILLIILIIFGVLIMLKPVHAIIKDSVNNIVYRGNVVTGTVAVDNGNGSYDVFIGESAEAYPNIFTLAENPDLSVGDKVRILYENGNKELPIILPPRAATVTAAGYFALIVTDPDEIRLYDGDGTLLKQKPVSGWAYSQCGITMDSQGNIYTNEGTTLLKKYDINLNELTSKSIESASNWIEGINFGIDGYLYTLEGIDSGFNVKKRNATDLSIVERIPISSDVSDSYQGILSLDSNGNIYVWKNDDDRIEKYNNSGSKLAQLDISGMVGGEYAGSGIVNGYLYITKYPSTRIYMPIDLSSYEEWVPGVGPIGYGIAATNGYLICTGWDETGSDGATAKFDSDRNLVWIKKHPNTNTYGYKAGGYNF